MEGRGIAFDANKNEIWMYTSHHVFRVELHREERNVWKLLLNKAKRKGGEGDGPAVGVAIWSDGSGMSPAASSSLCSSTARAEARPLIESASHLARQRWCHR